MISIRIRISVHSHAMWPSILFFFFFILSVLLVFTVFSASAKRYGRRRVCMLVCIRVCCARVVNGTLPWPDSPRIQSHYYVLLPNWNCVCVCCAIRWRVCFHAMCDEPECNREQNGAAEADDNVVDDNGLGTAIARHLLTHTHTRIIYVYMKTAVVCDTHTPNDQKKKNCPKM